MIAVARWDHPFHSLKRQVSRADMMGHTLVNIEGGSAGATKRQPLGAAQCHLTVGTSKQQSMQYAAVFTLDRFARIESRVRWIPENLFRCGCPRETKGRYGSTSSARIDEPRTAAHLAHLQGRWYVSKKVGPCSAYAPEGLTFLHGSDYSPGIQSKPLVIGRLEACLP